MSVWAGSILLHGFGSRRHKFPALLSELHLARGISDMDWVEAGVGFLVQCISKERVLGG